MSKPLQVETMRNIESGHSASEICIILATFGSEDDRDCVLHSTVYHDFAGRKLEMEKIDRPVRT